MSQFPFHSHFWRTSFPCARLAGWGERVGGRFCHLCHPWGCLCFRTCKCPLVAHRGCSGRRMKTHFKGIWKLAHETVLYRLQFVIQTIILTSSNRVPFFFSVIWIVAWNQLKESAWYKNMKQCSPCWKNKHFWDCLVLQIAQALWCLLQSRVGSDPHWLWNVTRVLSYKPNICEYSASGLQTQGL